jgi:hypothetical protein
MISRLRAALRSAVEDTVGDAVDSSTGDGAPELARVAVIAVSGDSRCSSSPRGNLVGIAPEDDRDTVAAAVRDAFGGPHEPLALGARLTPTRTEDVDRVGRG